MGKWLSIIGVGEDGLSGLSAAALALLSQAQVIVGGRRHLAMLSPDDGRERLFWRSPMSESIAEIVRRRGELICVLASGDPMWYGVGVILSEVIPIEEVTIIPAPSTFSLVCAKLGWCLTTVETLSLCGRPLSLLESYLYPGAKLIILSEGITTPAIVCDFLRKRGYGGSSVVVMEHLGGMQERIISSTAACWQDAPVASLNTIAVVCVADAGVRALSRLPGLPDDAYHHDGQLTKREIRAVTLSSLAPHRGELLWDVGAGCGSISIEWLRSYRQCAAIAIEHNPVRVNYIANNAISLGTPNLQIIPDKSPQALSDLPAPHAIFIGGGITAPGLFDICWQALRPGGRLVANVVTIEGEQVLLQWHNQVGGTLTRLAIQRAQPVGNFLGWHAMSPVTQLVVVKSPHLK